MKSLIPNRSRNTGSGPERSPKIRLAKILDAQVVLKTGFFNLIDPQNTPPEKDGFGQVKVGGVFFRKTSQVASFPNIPAEVNGLLGQFFWCSHYLLTFENLEAQTLVVSRKKDRKPCSNTYEKRCTP